MRMHGFRTGGSDSRISGKADPCVADEADARTRWPPEDSSEVAAIRGGAPRRPDATDRIRREREAREHRVMQGTAGMRDA